MTKRALTLQITGVTAIALLVAFYWALDPILIAIFMMVRTGITDAELIRQIWHVRLIQPELVSGPDQFWRWQQLEAGARLTLLFLAWLTSVMTLVRRNSRGKPESSNQTMQRTAGGLGSSLFKKFRPPTRSQAPSRQPSLILSR